MKQVTTSNRKTEEEKTMIEKKEQEKTNMFKQVFKQVFQQVFFFSLSLSTTGDVSRGVQGLKTFFFSSIDLLVPKCQISCLSVAFNQFGTTKAAKSNKKNLTKLQTMRVAEVRKNRRKSVKWSAKPVAPQLRYKRWAVTKKRPITFAQKF